MAYTPINKSSDYFNTLLWTGNGVDNRSITGVGFQPDWTWIKSRSNTDYHMIADAVRGDNKQVKTNSTDDQDSDTNKIKSFNSDGFTIGTGTVVNRSGATFVSWNLKANGTGSANTDGTINSTYTSANTTAGFSIVKYNGSGTAGTVGHGLGAVPKMIIIKEISGNASGGNQAWSVYHVANGNTHVMNLNTTGAKVDDIDFNDTTPTSSVFSVGSQNRVNSGNGNGVYVAYCFAEKTGYSKFGSYVGNGNANGAFIYTGFKPSFIMYKKSSGTGRWSMRDNKRDPFNVATKGLEANGSSTENTGSNYWDLDMLSNGFKLRTTEQETNQSGQTFIYMAFAEAPLVGSNNVPCTAR